MKAWNSTLSAGKGFKKKSYTLKRSTLRKISKDPVAETKRRIQALLRDICMARDSGCILAQVRCNRRIGDAGVVWQADHLISRSNSATYGDPRLVVLICRDCHGWKSLGSNLRKAEYDRLVRSILPLERVKLWDMAELEAGRHKGVKVDWTMTEIVLQAELDKLKEGV